MKLKRRDALIGAATGSVAWVLGGKAMAGEGDTKAKPGLKVAVGQHQLVSLSFDPKKIPGLSEKLLVSHHQNNYGGALKNLNKVEEELSRTSKETPGFIVAGLRERELTFTNSVILHELYFSNIGGNGKVAGEIGVAIDQTFGGEARFFELLTASAMGLAGGSGWVIVDLNFHSGDLRLYGSGHHSQSVSFGAPLLVLDMYEHAYHLDYGAAAAKYLEAFLANVDWVVVDHRYRAAKKALEQLKG